MVANGSTEKYRERRKDESDDEEPDDHDKDENDECLVSNLTSTLSVKSEKLSFDDQHENNSTFNDNFTIKPLNGLHMTFNLEAGSLLPLAIKFVLHYILYLLFFYFFRLYIDFIAFCFYLQRTSDAWSSFYIQIYPVTFSNNNSCIFCYWNFGIM